MILIHTNTYFLKDRVAFTLLELSQFAVVAFIFCSSYLFYQKSNTVTLTEFWEYLKKRTYRLLMPYYVFLVGHFFLLLLNQPKKVTYTYLFQNLALTGGIEFNWLVLLFVQLTILMPWFGYLHKNHKTVLYIYTIVAIAFSFIFLKYTPLSYFRLIMWLPWSLVMIYTLFVDRIGQNKGMFLGITVLFFVSFMVSRQYLENSLHHTLRMYGNKYPPNIYHLAYSLFCVNILYVLSKSNIFSVIGSIVHFFSKYSYTIYFIHILVIYVLRAFIKVQFDWIGFFILTIGVTSTLQLGYNRLTSSQH
ncbi:hypothetical protein A3K27_05475 [Candidatus Roizmanbacteria bacterium RIFOXYA1_FULL_37_12]|uniref:Acyltransferase 3 domain-containing protein n=1 Tax=Candidatus Roizmanbacteria bacterium RIFOXYD1_FULL_38_12 TaxID=1802093 RepID=A0A1F7L252_9BACT|nr:MAG: hypothetical protein A3K47_05475 [Candidatus Roizmanbacteria bacterium RIFOXYA2_FULL_38_14]OGK64194.1 MAG: hypothetical protein A3K27_05475 [Candidatus Roizmanbacteria bacterium RIFOXYA1_FULL_37_12]OGK66040.1 MAG: hypothetical protein A3K38_05475 [Candidatus Roizmanbacteria bacterium RIFOXYB1_FULL_40_23]OGK74187.1 MAG: hypothetical protein A3K52_05475 [Candidatus Roizmanbacteria bacterium RIFOXYD1_FULL_38_12]